MPVLYCISVEKELVLTTKYRVLVVKTKQLAADLVVWVVLIDQWPYRMSYLLEVWDDMHERPSTEPEDDADHNDCLIDVYE